MRIIIPGKLVSLNQYIQTERGHRYGGARIKREQTDMVIQCIKAQIPKKQRKIEGRVMMNTMWFCPDQRSDPDNIVFAKKFILDGMVKAGVLENDSFKHVAGFTDVVSIDKKNPRIVINVIPLAKV